MKPIVSVVIPCHNAEKHLVETLNSVIRQSFEQIEVLCVDNGSTDNTLNILNEYADKDSRFRVLIEASIGEGFARDRGRAEAHGEWLYFLDADDLMDKNLLKEAVNKGTASNSDIVVFKTRYLDDQSGEIRPCPECFDIDWINTWESPMVFSPYDNPSRLFNSFQNWVHNKLFKASFIKSKGLSFQHIHRMADIVFTCEALAFANKVALLNQELHTYRVNNPQSALCTGDSFPLDFYEAFLKLKEDLLKAGLFDLYSTSFRNWAEEAVAMNLYRTRSFEGFRAIFEAMSSNGIETLEIDKLKGDEVFNQIRHECCLSIMNGDIAQTAFLYFFLEKRRLGEVETELSRVRDSTSYKLGRKIIAPLGLVRDFIIRRI